MIFSSVFHILYFIFEKLLGVKVDHELNFNKHVSSLCKKASQKVNALSRIASYMTFDQRRLILNSFITSHFSYCAIVWMFHSRKLNERINHIHERALRIVYKDFNSCRVSCQQFFSYRIFRQTFENRIYTLAAAKLNRPRKLQETHV